MPHYHGQIVLSGFPSGTSAESLRRFLTSLEICGKREIKWIIVANHNEISSAVAFVPSGETIYEILRWALQTVPFEGKFIDCELHGTVWKEWSIVARSFHKYLLNRPDCFPLVIDRALVGTLSSQFYKEFDDSRFKFLRNNSLSGADFIKLFHILNLVRESKRMLLLRNSSGRYLSNQEVKDALSQLNHGRVENKFGVTVSDLPQQTFIKVNVPFNIALAIESSDSTVFLENVILSGIHKRYFKLKALRLPMTLATRVQLSIEVTAVNIGLLRTTITLHFDSAQNGVFLIARDISVCSGDEDLHKLLAVKSPYVRRESQTRSQEYDKLLPAPTITGENPFKELCHYLIPRHVTSKLTANKFVGTIKKPADPGAKGYGKFWQNLLWALEFQNLKDIQMYDMNDVQLQKSGNFLTLHVPGLAESRPSVLRGDIVHVTWNRTRYEGRVVQVLLSDVLMTFHQSFHRAYNPALDKVSVCFTFSRVTYRTSHKGSCLAERCMPMMLFPTPNDTNVLQLKDQSRDVTSDWKWANRDLNPEQRNAIVHIVEGVLRPLPYIIFGPPGTGKTTTVIEAVYQLVMQKLKVLLVAPSNDAADILIERLAQYFPPSKMRRILAYGRSISNMKQSIRTYCRDGLSFHEQRKEIFSDTTEIVVSTVNLSARFSYFGIPVGHFDVLIVDEAGHATEPEVVAIASTLIDFSKAGQLVLAGDPMQLGPIITSSLCRSFGMSLSYLERLTKRVVYSKNCGMYNCSLLTKLVRNYRSHPDIIKLPNELFYDNELQCHGDILTTHNLMKWEHLPVKNFPLLFHNVFGANLQESNSPSWFNPQEVQLVVSYVNLLIKETRPALTAEDIGIITPYARQAEKIRTALTSKKLGAIKVGSVEIFQGQERRCIIISTVRSEQELVSSDLRYNLGFVAHEKRFNVAITRAKALLIVIGCAKVLALDKKNWFPFLRHCKDKGSWRGDDWDLTDVADDIDKEVPDSYSDSDWYEEALPIHRED